MVTPGPPVRRETQGRRTSGIKGPAIRGQGGRSIPWRRGCAFVLNLAGLCIAANQGGETDQRSDRSGLPPSHGLGSARRRHPERPETLYALHLSGVVRRRL